MAQKGGVLKKGNRQWANERFSWIAKNGQGRKLLLQPLMVSPPSGEPPEAGAGILSRQQEEAAEKERAGGLYPSVTARCVAAATWPQRQAAPRRRRGEKSAGAGHDKGARGEATANAKRRTKRSLPSAGCPTRSWANRAPPVLRATRHVNPKVPCKRGPAASASAEQTPSHCGRRQSLPRRRREQPAEPHAEAARAAAARPKACCVPQLVTGASWPLAGRLAQRPRL